MPNQRKAFVATIQVVVIADDEGSASDGISELMHGVEERLNKPGEGNDWLLDWQYTNMRPDPALPGAKTGWREIVVPTREDYEEGEVFAKGGPLY